MKEERTISKHFDDSEIIGRLPNGDLVLKPGVKRLKYVDADEVIEQEEGEVGSKQSNDWDE